MKLVDIMPYITKTSNLDELIRYLKIVEDPAFIFIYMTGEININNDIYLFTINEIDGRMRSEKDGIEYVQLFDLYTLSEVIVDLGLLGKGYDNLTIAKKLIEYRINDA